MNKVWLMRQARSQLERFNVAQVCHSGSVVLLREVGNDASFRRMK